MRNFRDKNTQADFDRDAPRTHPWTTAKHDPSQRYEDFKAHPDRVEAVLTDFSEWKEREGVRAFFELVRHLNAPACLFETNDCAFEGPRPNDTQDEPADVKGQALVSRGRLMVFLRDISWNTRDDLTEWILGAFATYLEQFSASPTTVVGLCFCPSHFLGVGLGRELVFRWWTWGQTESEVLAGLAEVAAGIRWSADQVEARIREEQEQGPTA